MKYTKKSKETNVVELTIKLDGEEWEKAVEAAYNKNKGKYNMQGFRKGHVPRKVLEGIYGEGVFYEDAINLAFPQYYGEVLDKEAGVIPVDSPELDIKDVSKDGITLIAKVTTKPEVELGEYKGLSVEKIVHEVKDEDIDNEIMQARERASRLVPVEGRPAEKGDMVDINYSGSVDGVKFDGGTAENQSLELGSGMFIPGFEDQVIGMNTGDEKDINVTFPENYSNDLAGKAAVFAIKVNAIKKKEIPELDDEFVKDVSEFNTVDEYKANIKKDLEEKNAKRADQETENKLVDVICGNAKLEIPTCMIDQQVDNMIQEFSYKLMYQGLKLDAYLKYSGMTMDALRESYKEQAKKAVTTRLVFEKLIDVEKIEVSDEELDAKIKAQAESVSKDFEEYKKGMPERQMNYILNELVIDKLFNRLKELNPVK